MTAWLTSAFPFQALLGVLDPVLYDALVTDVLALSAPEPISIRRLRYDNPVWATLFGKESAEKTVSATAEVIEVVTSRTRFAP